MSSRSVAALLGLTLTLAVLFPREAVAQSPPIETFVTGLYVYLLGHQPDAQALSTWTTVVASNCNPPGLGAVTRAFLGSAEFADRSLTLAGLVVALVGALFGREATAGEVAAGVVFLRAQRVDVALTGFIRSAEFRSLAPDPRDPATATALISRWYAEILGRAPAASELASHVDHLVGTGDVEGAAVGLLASPEFESRLLTFRGYVDILYRAFLARPPDLAGQTAWEQALRDRLLGAIDGVVGLPEFQARAEQICGTAWCAKASPLQTLAVRFPGHRGPDVLVRTDLGQSLQDAVAGALDVNADGYIIVGVVAGPGGEADGRLTQRLVIVRDFGLPFALVGCGLTLHDPAPAEAQPTAWIRAGARSPNLLVIDVGATGSGLVGWLVEGDGRYLRTVDATGNTHGLAVIGNGNTIDNGRAEENAGLGVYVDGHDNTVIGNDVVGNGDTGIFLKGTGNRLAGNRVGERGRGNGGTGIHAEGARHLIEENTVLRNGGHGIEVTGGDASGPNVVRKNQVGDRDRGNGGHGIVVAGTGNGGGGPVEIDENDVAGNVGDGVRVTGSGHQLRDNASGGAGDLDNGGCEFAVSAGNLDAGGNRVNGVSVDGSGGSFPTGCLGTP
jgi:parallel beta-helix repeat protein